MNQNHIMNDFREYQKNQRELADILKEASKVTRNLTMSKERELDELSQKIQNDAFKIMVTGTFKNGKSTFINAMLGEEVLPAYALPCTAVINEVKYGVLKRAVLHFRNPLPDSLPNQLAPKAVRHMEQYKGRAIPSLEIPYDEIEDYVVIPMGADEKQMKLQSPYEKVELFYPLELLKNGVEIIDSPGLNEDETRTRVTMDYLMKVDAILYVLNANAICAGDEMRFVKNDLRGGNIDSVFFVVNRFDQIRAREQPEICRYAELKLKEFYEQPELFCVSALNALEGRLEGNDTLVEESGMTPLEKRLTEFLTEEKGKAKLISPARQVRHILSREALEVVIPRERKLLETSLKDLENKYAKIRPKLEIITREKDQKKAELDMKIERSARKFERSALRKISEIMDSIPTWVEEYTPPTSLGAIPTKKKTEQVVTEISEYLKTKTEDEYREWQNSVLKSLIEEEADSIFGAVEQDISRIFSEIDSIHIELTDSEYDANPVPVWQRVAGVAGGLMIGDVGLAFSGGVNGIGKEFAKTAAFELGAGFMLGLFGILNPVTLIAVVVAAFLYNFGKGASKAMDKLKKKVSEAVAKDLSNEKADKMARDLADGIKCKFEELEEQIIDSISKEVDDIDRQVKSVMEEKARGQNDVENRKKELEKSEKIIHELNGRLDALVFALAGA
ncbi:hypothetical protein D7X88_11865 [bacterium C-53]|nr:hypothetical protein [Lachnospiraceae bacterium]NBI03724.1 hypothetical protein [Lachnospiraceae bacterium]RKJ09279.1 hypothetical protein D7X88_11865 [bacterium C-53]